MAYNTTNMTDANSFLGIVQEINVMTDHRLGILLVVAVCILITIALIRNGYNPMSSLSIGSFMAGMFGMFMFFSGLMTEQIAIPFIAVSIIIAILSYFLRPEV